MRLPSAKSLFLAAIGIAALLIPALARAAEPKVLRFAFQGELKSVDPYQINESFSLSVNGAVYEGLVRRGPDMKIEPCLATSWEVLDPLHWRFHLRKGVKFHEGQDFTADDVIFSAHRVLSAGSDLKGRIPADAEIVKVDDYTVDFLLKAPDPLLINEWESWDIFSKELVGGAWRDRGHSDERDDPALCRVARQWDRTVHPRQPRAWREDRLEAQSELVGQAERSNIDEVVFTPIPNAATRVAALLSGEIDWMDPVPLNDQARVNANPGTEVLAGPEIRTIFLGMDQSRDELGHSNVKGKNPFKDVRVRKAFYEAIDEDAIYKKVMRGQATPTALMIAPSLFSLSKDFHRLPFDPAESKKLLAEAGYPDGFEVQMDCPNDRYVNDEQICQAVVGMLARIGVKVDLQRRAEVEVLRRHLGRRRLMTARSISWAGRRRRSRASTSSNTSWAAATRRPTGAATTSATIAIRRSTRWLAPPCRSRTKRSATRSSPRRGESRCSTTSAIFRCISRRWPGAFRSPPT